MHHHVFDIALSRSKHRTVGGGLPAMKSDAIFLIYRVIVHRGQAPSHKKIAFLQRVMACLITFGVNATALNQSPG